MAYFTLRDFINFVQFHFKKEGTPEHYKHTKRTSRYAQPKEEIINILIDLPEDVDINPSEYRTKISAATASNYYHADSFPGKADFSYLTYDIIFGNVEMLFPSDYEIESEQEDYEELLALLCSAQNVIDDNMVDTFKQKEGFKELLAAVFEYTFLENERIYYNYGKKEILKNCITDTLPDMQVAKPMHKSEKKEPAILTALRHISNYMYQKILENEQRYHSAHINDNLLSFGKVTGQKIYDADMTEKTLMHYFESSKNHLYIYGPGGIGKTTFLVTLMKQYHSCNDTYIPLYLSLADLKKYANSTYDEDNEITSCISSALWERFKKCKNNISGDNAIAINRYNEDSFKDLLAKTMCKENSAKKILLLLDGINEISIEKNSYIRKRLLDEMHVLSKQRNVRIIATTRPFPIAKNDFLSDSISIEASGIQEDTLLAILKDNKLIQPDSNLLSILRIPLFLNMYLSVQKNNSTNASTRGAILYDFYNNISSQYNEKSHDRLLRKNDPDRPSIIPLILDFILPAFAARMEMEDCFTLPKDVFREIVNDRLSYVKPFANHSNNIFSKLYPDEEYLLEAMEAIPNATTVLQIVRNQLSLFTIYSDINDDLSFTHQYIRDYFASIFRLNAFCSMDFDDDNVYSNYLESNLSSETMELANEILIYSEHYQTPFV